MRHRDKMFWAFYGIIFFEIGQYIGRMIWG